MASDDLKTHNDSSPYSANQPTSRALADDGPAAGHKFSARILSAGFVFALVLASVCLIASTVYLYTFLAVTMQKIDGLLARAGTPGVTDVLIQLGINAALVSARLALLSCGVFVAMSFGFLGFGLFLIGVRGEIEASGTSESFGFKVARMSPGVFVMTATLILIGVCVTHRTPFDYRMEQPAPTAVGGERAAESVLKRLAATPAPPIAPSAVNLPAAAPAHASPAPTAALIGAGPTTPSPPPALPK